MVAFQALEIPTSVVVQMTNYDLLTMPQQKNKLWFKNYKTGSIDLE